MALFSRLLFAAAVVFGLGWQAAEAAGVAQFDCAVAEGPRLTGCRAPANLPDGISAEGADILRASIEDAPACQLGHLTPGERTTWREPLPDDLSTLTEDFLRAERVRQPERVNLPNGPGARYYPDRAQRYEMEGRAVVACKVNRNGAPKDCQARLEEPAGYGFGEAAVEIAEDFRFRPAMRGCQTIDGEVAIPITFRLPKPGQGGRLSDQIGEATAPWAPHLGLRDLGYVAVAMGGAGLAALGLFLTLRPRAEKAPAGLIEMADRRPPAWLLMPAGLVLAGLGLWLLAPSMRSAGAQIALRGLDTFPAVSFAMFAAFAAIGCGLLLQFRAWMLKDTSGYRSLILEEWTRRGGWMNLLMVEIWTPDPRLMTDGFFALMVRLARGAVIVTLAAIVLNIGLWLTAS